MVRAGPNQYTKAIQFSDTGGSSHLEKLFADNIAAMLEQGIAAKNVQIDLNGDK